MVSGRVGAQLVAEATGLAEEILSRRLDQYELPNFAAVREHRSDVRRDLAVGLVQDRVEVSPDGGALGHAESLLGRGIQIDDDAGAIGEDHPDRQLFDQIVLWRNRRDVTDVMVAGTWRVRNREVLGVDLAELRARVSEQATRLWSN